MKKVLAIVISIVLLSTIFPVKAFALVDGNFNKDIVEKTVISEYDMVVQRAIEDKESNEEIFSDIVEYQRAFDTRCKLSEDELANMGYTDEQISLMKRYADGELSFDSVAKAASAKLTTKLTCSTHTTTKYVVKYTFSWSAIPVGLGQDGIALGAYGIDKSSHSFNTKTSAKSGSVKYYYNDGTYYKTESPKLTTDDPGFSAKFASYKQNSTGSDWVYAKSGSFSLTIVPTVSGSTTFAAARARGSYGHSSGTTTKIAIDVSLVSGKISISFSKSSTFGSVSAMGTKQTVFYNNGKKTVE